MNSTLLHCLFEFRRYLKQKITEGIRELNNGNFSILKVLPMKCLKVFIFIFF